LLGFEEFEVFSLFFEATSTKSVSKGSHMNVVNPEHVESISPVLLNLLIFGVSQQKPTHCIPLTRESSNLATHRIFDPFV
jgi:hypothetical protein